MSAGAQHESIAGFPTHVARRGTGPRPALFIHCTLGHSGAWAGVQAPFHDRLSMTAFDRPGHGRSGDWDGGDDGRALHDLNTAIAGALLDGPADVIGHSYGATVALRLALERPGQVRSLVLIEPVMFAAIRGAPEYAGGEAMIGEMRARIDRGERAAAARLFNDMTNPEQPFDSLPADRQARLARRIGIVVQESPATFDDVTGMLAPGRLEQIDLPVLILESGNPPPGVASVHRALDARIPQARRVVLDDGGHMAPITHPDMVAGEIAAFLQI